MRFSFYILLVIFCVGCSKKSDSSEQSNTDKESTPSSKAPQVSPKGEPGPADGEPAKTGQSPAPKLTLEERQQAALKAKGPKYVPRTKHKDKKGVPKYTNRLIFESSPYLLQHAHNPVDWHPWGPEAFAKAKKLDRPILLSVGYATCHWCHVMEEESFEDEEIAKYMSDNFVCVKVDREERPDVDHIYMSAVYMLAGRGGWPMTVVMTPDKEPFFAGTYFPPRAGVRRARKGFIDILKELSTQFKNDRANIVSKAKTITQRIAKQVQTKPALGVPAIVPLAQTAQRMVQRHDPVWGGFGRAPKFPRPVTLDMLLRHHHRSGDKSALDAVTTTLNKMADGGLYDQIGGGFHRYSVDGRWLVPHFEKMLYDNGQLAVTYLDAYQVTKNPRFAQIATEVLDYVIKEMRDPTYAFWSATDADSEGEEGVFFVWKPEEILKVLGPARGKIAIRYWGVTQQGNFEHKTNIMYLPRPGSIVAKELGMTEQALMSEIDTARKQLYEHRLKRIPPITDDKVLTAWNGLLISGLARATFILGNNKYSKSAKRAGNFILSKMRDGKRLLRTYRDGIAKITSYVEDYAFLAQGFIDLYEATQEVRWLHEAIELHKQLDLHYLDKTNGGYFRTAHDAEKLLAKSKPDYDGAEPCGNSVAARNLLRLYEYTGNTLWRTRAEGILKWASGAITRRGPAVPAMLSALDTYHATTRQVIIVLGSDSIDDQLALKRVVSQQYLPNRVVVYVNEADVATVSKDIPYVAKKIARNGKSTAYVCERGICKKPTSDPKELAAQLAAKTL